MGTKRLFRLQFFNKLSVSCGLIRFIGFVSLRLRDERERSQHPEHRSADKQHRDRDVIGQPGADQRGDAAAYTEQHQMQAENDGLPSGHHPKDVGENADIPDRIDDALHTAADQDGRVAAEYAVQHRHNGEGGRSVHERFLRREAVDGPADHEVGRKQTAVVHHPRNADLHIIKLKHLDLDDLI